MADTSPQAALEHVLAAQRPDRIMTVGRLRHLSPATYLREHGDVQVTELSPAEAVDALARIGRQDLVVLEGALEELPRRDGEILLSRLRDIYARRLLVAVRADADWQHADFTAFGLVHLGRVADSGSPVSLYGFDMATYKTTPDWLNPRHWANPELWGKFRW